MILDLSSLSRFPLTPLHPSHISRAADSEFRCALHLRTILTMPSPTLSKLLNPNIDTFLNPFVPHNQVRHLPKPISHFLGHRSHPAKEPPTLVQWLSLVIATVAGLCVVGAVFTRAPGIAEWNPPPIVASLGASAVLDYNTIRSPLSQPRNAIVGHTIAAIVGTAISKAFQNVPHFFHAYSWVCAAVACAAASVAMSMTNTVHPPGGATAIIACTEATVIVMGWRFPAIMLVASALMVAVACLLNNIARQYPVFWWTPEDVGYRLPRRKGGEEKKESEDEEMGEKETKGSDQSDQSDRTLARELSGDVEFDELFEVQILPYKMRLPAHLHLEDEEIELLKGLQARIRARSEVD